MALKTVYTKRDESARMDQLFATTVDTLVDHFEEQVFKDRPSMAILFELMDREMFAGGEQARIPIITGKNPNGGWVDEDEGLSMDDYDPTNTAIYWPKSAAYGVKWTKAQMRANRGKNQKISLIDMKIDNTVESLRDTINEGSWGSGGGKTMDGWQNMIPATAEASQSVSFGGIDPSQVIEWRTKAINMSGDSAISQLEDRMLTMWNRLFVDKGQVSYIFTDRITHETYEKNARDMVLAKIAKIADVNFELLHYKGAPLVFDNEAPAQEMRFIDRRHVKFAIDPEYWFTWTDWKEALNVPFTKHKQVVCDLNLCTNARRRLGCIFNIDN